MDMGASKIIIIPDLHGREFWRGAVKALCKDTHPDWARKQSPLFGPLE